ncbi:MAG: hypothetical protein QM770_05280 [Tepidisphaeraceae bacterium]
MQPSLRCSCAQASNAQTIYEPLRVQFGRENKYYYGGTDPWIHDVANALRSSSGMYGRVHGYRLVTSRRTVEYELPRVYNDFFGSQDAYSYGYTADNAYNDARALQPRYFRKADVQAIPAEQGIRVVPAIPTVTDAVVPRGSIVIKPYRAPIRRGPVFIFPKSLLDKPLDTNTRRA